MKKTICLLVLLMLLLTSCNINNKEGTKVWAEQNEIDSSETYVETYVERIEPGIESLFESSRYIVKGEFKEILFDGYINPNGDKALPDGTVIKNYYVTRYNFLVTESFKGDINVGDTIIIDVKNECSYDEYLNKKNNDSETSNDLNIEVEDGGNSKYFLIDTSKDAILTLIDDTIKIDGDPDNMYGVWCLSDGYFANYQEGLYKSSSYEFNIDEIENYLS